MDKKNIYISLGLLSATLIGLSIWQRNKVIYYAKKFIGYTEISGNLGFNNPEFQQKMIDAGWKKGEPWCMYFAKVIWMDKYKKYSETLGKLLTGGTQLTYSNFINYKGSEFKVNKSPSVGDIAIWQTYVGGVPQNRGHAGIVTKVLGDEFKTIEGNTNEGGSREGYVVAEKTRSLSKEIAQNNGLRIKGFIHKA